MLESVEAMRCGAPVVVSDTPALAELIPDPESRFDPISPASIRNVILRGLTDPQFRARLSEHSRSSDGRFDWNDVARKTAAAYESVLRRAARSPRGRRRERWAVVSPLPRRDAGGPDAISRLIQELAIFCAIDVFVEGDSAAYRPCATRHARVVDSRLFESSRELTPYDRVIYVLGDGNAFTYVREIVNRHSGDVILLQATDLRLPGLADILEQAGTVIVPTETARQMVLLQQPSAVGQLRVVPLPMPDPDPALESPASRTVVAMDVGHDSVNATRLVRALAHCSRQVTDIRLVLLNPTSTDVRERVLDCAHALGVAHRLTLPAPASAAGDVMVLRGSTLAVQFAQSPSGDLPIALGHCLAAGVPTLVMDVGALAELPRDSVVHLPAGIDDGQLARILEQVLTDPVRRQGLRAAALACAEAHSARESAKRIWQLLGQGERLTLPQRVPHRQRKIVARLPSVASQSGSQPVAGVAEERVTTRTVSVSLPPSAQMVSSTRVDIVVDAAATDPISESVGTGTLEDGLIQLLLELVRPGSHVLDVGAHIGTFSLAAAAHGCRVLAVEASASNVRLLAESVAINRFPDVKVVHAAATDRSGAIGFWPLGPWGHVATPDMPSDRVVTGVVLDDLLDELGWSDVDAIKIDVEGSELAVLRGLHRRLSGLCPPMLLYECNAHTLSLFDLTPRHLFMELASRGYRSYRVESQTLVPVEPHDFQPTLSADYLAVRRDLPSLRSWPVRRPLTFDETVERSVMECQHPSHEHRLWMARGLATADPRILSAPMIQTALCSLANDPVTAVRRACAWSRGSSGNPT